MGTFRGTLVGTPPGAELVGTLSGHISGHTFQIIFFRTYSELILELIVKIGLLPDVSCTILEAWAPKAFFFEAAFQMPISEPGLLPDLKCAQVFHQTSKTVFFQTCSGSLGFRARWSSRLVLTHRLPKSTFFIPTCLAHF